MANPDLDKLLGALVPFAQQMLGKQQGFYPFGASMDLSGKIAMVAADLGSEQPPTQALIDLLTKTLRQQASTGTLRAAGICCDIRTIPPGQQEKMDAICASLEHQNGEAVDVCVPYKKGWFGRVSYGDTFAARRDKSFFPG